MSTFDRREFICATGTAAAVTLLPVPSLVTAGPTQNAVTGPKLTDWTVDDMFGGYPRYCEAIGFGRPSRVAGANAAAVDAVLHA